MEYRDVYTNPRDFQKTMSGKSMKKKLSELRTDREGQRDREREGQWGRVGGRRDKRIWWGNLKS